MIGELHCLILLVQSDGFLEVSVLIVKRIAEISVENSVLKLNLDKGKLDVSNGRLLSSRNPVLSF